MAQLREAQRLTLEKNNVGMAVIMDVGDSLDIHPKPKKPVGDRLALLALAKNYGKKDLVFSGPLFKEVLFKEENAIAGCVQTEINNELLRQQKVQTYANSQARANAIQRNNALSNMGRCLSTEGNFAACSNAWNGYTPKRVVKCDYDMFGNKITSTCREQ